MSRKTITLEIDSALEDLLRRYASFLGGGKGGKGDGRGGKGDGGNYWKLVIFTRPNREFPPSPFHAPVPSSVTRSNCECRFLRVTRHFG
jgi:hypothetical protein